MEELLVERISNIFLIDLSRLSQIFMPDRQVTPKLWEVRKIYQRVAFESADAGEGKFKVTNKFAFTNLADSDWSYTVSEDGAVVSKGDWTPQPVAPGETKALALPVEKFTKKPGREYFLRVDLRLRAANIWGEKGHSVAWEQLPVSNAMVAPILAVGKLPALGMSEEIGSFAFTAGGTRIEFDKSTGLMSSFQVDKREMIKRGPWLNTFRAFVDNDTWFQRSYWESGLGGMAHRSLNVSAQRLSPSVARVSVDMDCRGYKGRGFFHRAVYTILGDGTVTVDNQFDPVGDLPQLPKTGSCSRLGTSWRLRFRIRMLVTLMPLDMRMESLQSSIRLCREMRRLFVLMPNRWGLEALRVDLRHFSSISASQVLALGEW